MSEENVRAVARFQAILDTEDVVSSLSDPAEADRLSAALEAEAGADFEVAMVGPDYTTRELAGKGAAGFQELWREWMSAFESFRIEIEQVVDAGEQVVTLVSQVGRTRTGGVEIVEPAAAVWTVRHARVTRVEFHLDQDEAMRRAGLEPKTTRADRQSGHE